jgi:DNA-binding HxlR family transcriptional regulator
MARNPLRAGKLPVKPDAPAGCTCVVGGAIDLIGKKWTMCIVVTVGNRPGVRFNQLLDLLDGISPRTLSDTLKALEKEGLVERKAFAEIPPRVEYRLSADGGGLLSAIAPLMVWASSRPNAICQPMPAAVADAGLIAVKTLKPAPAR